MSGKVGPMTERRLPPALEEKVYNTLGDHGILDVNDILDWLYGKEVTWPVAEGDGFPVTTPSLVERVEERVNRVYPEALRMGYEVMEALRAELADEASAALDKFKGEET